MYFHYEFKYLLDFFVGLILISLSFIGQPLNARNLNYLSMLNPSQHDQFKKIGWGMDLTYLQAASKEDYSNIFKKKFPGCNFYVGLNFNGILLEAGYAFTARRAKEYNLNAGNNFLGLLVTDDTTFTGKVRFKKSHITLNFLANFLDNLKIITAVGIGFVRPPTILLHNVTNTDNPTAYPSQIIPKTNLIPKLGIGLGHVTGNNHMFRFMFYFERYSKIAYKSLPNPAVDRAKLFKDAYSLSLGVLF